MATKTLVVCSMTNWIAQDFRDANIPGWDVVSDRGFDLPIIPQSKNVAWWMPTEHAVKLRYSGFKIPFMAPGPHWLPGISQDLTRRKISTCAMEEIMDTDFKALSPNGKLWVKPAEFKHPEFFAGLYGKDDIAGYNLPKDALLQWTDTVLNLTEEHRFYIVDGKVKTGSVYLAHGVTYYDGAVSHKDDEAYNFALSCAQTIGTGQPPAYTLDVAYDETTESWILLEGNPMFSSAIYGSDPAIVAECLLRCANPLPEESSWLWTPDSFLLQKYARMRPLR